VKPYSPLMEKMTVGEIIELTRDAYTLAAEVYTFFHNTVRKNTKPKVSFIDPASPIESLHQSEKKTTNATNAKVKSTKEFGDTPTKTPANSMKIAKKERRKRKVNEKELVKADSESSRSDKRDLDTIQELELLTKAIALSKQNGQESKDLELLRFAIAWSTGR